MILHNTLIILLVSGYYCAPVVETPLGSVQGYIDTSFQGKTFLAFEGIPYGKPPVGEKRFELPEPIEPWDGILNATISTTCPQTYYLVGSEDCLHVNVYVPREEINPDERLQVVVYIHGGAFLLGSGSSNRPLHVMDKDVVFVTFNYRLGVLGFLSTEDEVLPGNNGLKDQVMALEWIQKNIASFGGNPDSVTLFGLSAGSTSVHLHYFSPLSKGLFHRGFSQSGTALGPTTVTEGSLDRAKVLADSLGCPVNTSQDLVSCLKKIPYESILGKINLFRPYNTVPIRPFGAVVEKGGPKPFLTEDPYISLKNGQVQDLPFITSNTLDEGLLIVGGLSNEDITNFNENWNKVAPVLFDFNYTLAETEWDNASEEIRTHYFGDDAITTETLIKASNDRYFYYGSDDSIKMQSNVTQSPVYFFIFGYKGESGTTTVGHGAESKYMFSSSLTDNELKMKDLLWNMIVSFAKTDKPIFGNLEGTPTTHDEDIYVEVLGAEDEDIKSLNVTELADKEFWKSLNFAENDNLPNQKSV